MEFAIQLKDVSKAYRVMRQRPFLAKEIVRRILHRPSSVELFWALKNVTFDVEAGESIGVIGGNGSGKSTLLSLIAKTSYPTSGEVTVEGRIGPLLELGAGFQPELTGQENIYLNGALLGLSREQVDDKLDAIIEFSGLGDFIYSPLVTYSTGMSARLGFAVIAHIDPDILLIDEVLAVGDAEFQLKCHRTMEQFRERGKTMFFVSHDLESVKRLCSRAVWIRSGEVAAIGDPAEIAAMYQNPTSG